MFASALIAFYRSFRRHPLYAVLNLLGLSLGIAVFIALSLFVRFENSFETWVPDRAKIDLIGTQFFFPGMSESVWQVSMGGLLEEIQTDYPQVQGTRDRSQSVTVQKGDQIYTEQVELVDRNFLTFFGVKMVSGDPVTALSEPGHIVISEAMSRKYFSTTQVMGKTLSLSDNMGRRAYIISGVTQDLPRNSEFVLDILTPLTSERVAKEPLWRRWGIVQLATYVKFETPAQAAAFGRQLDGFVDRHAGEALDTDIPPHKRMHLSLIPLADVHFMAPKYRATVLSLGLVGIVAFALAAINYINLATARAGMRAREVAVRKSLGATQTALRLQFLIEAVLMSLLAALLALSFVELTLPVINAAGGLFLRVDYLRDASWLVALIGVVTAAGIIAGLYPAFVLAGFQPAQVLASARTPAGGRFGVHVREALVVIQFALVTVALILTLGFVRQIHHMKNEDLGFRRGSLLLVQADADTLTSGQRQSLTAAFKAMPHVGSVTVALGVPGDDSTIATGGASPLGRNTDNGLMPTLYYKVTGPDYFTTYGAHLLAGRFLDQGHGADQMAMAGVRSPMEKPDTVTNVVLDRQAAARMGFASPSEAINKLLLVRDHHKVRIVGVIEGMRFNSPREPRRATLYLFDGNPCPDFDASIRYSGLSEAEMRTQVATVWRDIAPDVPPEINSADASLDHYYKPDRDRSNLFGIGAGIVVLIGCIGLYGMAAFNTSRRSLEIGLRKVLGASRGQVVRLLVWQFLRPVLLANLIAWPLAWWLLKSWLSQFDDAIAMTPVYFLAPSAAALLIALVTVTGLTFITAGTEPGRVLRHD